MKGGEKYVHKQDSVSSFNGLLLSWSSDVAELVCEFKPLKLDPASAEWHNRYIHVHWVYL